MKGKYLITTDNWFYAPNGKQYNAIWGEIEIISDSILGIKTNMRSSNWFAKIGTEDNNVIVAGCQIHYAVKSEHKPNTDDVIQGFLHDGEPNENKTRCNIYIAD